MPQNKLFIKAKETIKSLKSFSVNANDQKSETHYSDATLYSLDDMI